MQLLVTICARGGSKGIPGKNIMSLGGKPLIAYTIAHAQTFAKAHGADIALSTDSKEIRSVAAEYGLTTEYLRPAELSGDTVGKVAVITALLHHSEKAFSRSYDMVLDLDVASPLRTMKDLEQGLKMMQADADALNLFSVSPARRNPYMNMVECDKHGYCTVVKTPATPIFSRQQAPAVYELNGSFYYYRRAFFDAKHDSAITDRTLAYAVPHLCFDIDEPTDLDVLESLLAAGKLDTTLLHPVA